MVQGVELAQQQTIFNVLGLDLDDFDVFVNGQVQHLLRRGIVLHVAQRAQVDASQQLMCFQVVGILLDHVLRGENGIANPPGLEVELRQSVVQIGRIRIGIQRKLVFLNRAGRIFGRP